MRARPPRSLTPSKTMSQRDAGGGEHVAIEAREGVGAEAVGEQMVAADAVVETRRCCCVAGRGLKASGENIGPAVVAVGGGAVAVGNGIAKGDDGGRRRALPATSISET